MIERGDADVSIYGEENVRESHTELLLKKYVITSDDDEYEIYKEEENREVRYNRNIMVLHKAKAIYRMTCRVTCQGISLKLLPRITSSLSENLRFIEHYANHIIHIYICTVDLTEVTQPSGAFTSSVALYDRYIMLKQLNNA